MTADETPLLPEPIRAMPFDWGQWPDEEDEETVGLARAILEAALPSEPLPVPEPPFLHDDEKFYADDEEAPDWVYIWPMLIHQVDDIRHITAGQMTVVEAECAREGLDTRDFQEVWVRRITGWVVEKTLEWCGIADDLSRFEPWFPELAEQYVRRGLAAEKAVLVLRATAYRPESRAALLRLSEAEGLPEEIRESIENGLRKQDS